MKKLILLGMLMIQILLVSGCSQINLNRTEIDHVFNTRIIAIDKIEENKILYTITTKSSSLNTQAQAGTPKNSEVLVSEGATVFEAARTLLASAHKKPHYGHTEFILFGEDTAKDGILPYLDYIGRNQEFRYNAKICIVKGETANAFLNKLNSGDMYLADKLSLIEENADALSIARRITLTETLFTFSKQNVDLFLPYIVITPTKGGEQKSHGDYNMAMSGYAIFNKEKLYELLDPRSSRGINWITNNIKSGLLLVDAPDQKKVSLEIIQSKTSIKPSMDENELHCTIKIQFNTNISEIESKVDLFNEEGFDYLKQQQEQIVKKEVEDILRHAQEINLDIFDIATKFRIKYPLMKDDLSNQWKELFPEIKFHVEVDSKVNRTYLIKQPAESK